MHSNHFICATTKANTEDVFKTAIVHALHERGFQHDRVILEYI